MKFEPLGDRTIMRISFTDHPASVGESYFEHMAVASGFGLRMLLGALACLAHGVFPFLFVKTGSATIAALHERMLAGRVTAENMHKAPPAMAEAD